MQESFLTKVQNPVKQTTTSLRSWDVPGGCVNGGGQPQVRGSVRNFTDVRAIRAKALYENDAAKTIRKSHENPAIQQLYKEYFGEPGSHKAHEVLHTTYVKRVINK